MYKLNIWRESATNGQILFPGSCLQSEAMLGILVHSVYQSIIPRWFIHYHNQCPSLGVHLIDEGCTSVQQRHLRSKSEPRELDLSIPYDKDFFQSNFFQSNLETGLFSGFTYPYSPPCREPNPGSHSCSNTAHN